MRTNFLRKIKRAFLPLVVFAALVLPPAPLLPVLAGNAVLYLSPSGGTRYVGSSFAVSVRINSGSHTTNAYKAVVKFPTALLAATSVSVGGSICTLQISGSPSYSNSSGTVNFECGHPGSFSGSAGERADRFLRHPSQPGFLVRAQRCQPNLEPTGWFGRLLLPAQSKIRHHS